MGPSGRRKPPLAWRWSISRSHLLRDCARAFRFQLRAAGTAPSRSGAIKLAALTGIAIHGAISRELDVWASGGKPSERNAIASAVTFVDHAWENRAQQVLEVKNGFEVDPAQVEVYRRVVRGRLERFFEMIWPQFSYMRHESHEKLEEFGGCALPVALKIDLACWDPNQQLVIADWKTGSWQNLVGGRVQLAVYALWARSKLDLPLTSILPMLVSLQTGEIVRFQPNEYDIDFVRREIQKDRDQAREYAAMKEFPASPTPEKCWGCPHLSKCGEGREVAGL